MSLLGNGTLANAGAPYYSGGGGGSNNPNLNVSTMNVAPGGTVNLRYLSDRTTELNFDNDSGPTFTTSLIYDDSPGISSLSIYLKGNDEYAPATLNVNSLIGVSSINGAAPGGAISTFDSISLNGISSLGSEVVINQNLAVGNVIACSGLSTVIISPLNSGDPVTISSLAVSSINGAAPGGAAISSFNTAYASSLTVSSIQAPYINGSPYGFTGYNVAPWQGTAINMGVFGLFTGVLNLGGNISGGGFSSTLQIPPVLDFTATNYMTGTIVSGATGSGALNDVAISFPNTSSMYITATAAGTIGTLLVTVMGQANGLI